MNKQGAKYKISPRGKRKLDYPTKVSKPSTKLPLIGKTIYLDVKETKHLKRLQQDLKKLGATLEDFVSRDINYLITSQPRPKNKAANPCGDDSPTPSPFNCDPSPSPGYPEDKKVTSVTRGKALLEKARYTRQASTLVDNAEKWGVKIVTIEGAFKWIDKELKKLPKSTVNLSKKSIKPKCVSSYKLFKSPFVKLEAESFCYRPFHTELDVWPRLNVDTPRGSCPFDGTLIKGGDESREERGELLAAQVDIPSEDTPKEEKDGSESAHSTPKPAAEKSGKKSDSEVFGGSRIMTAGELKRKKDLKRKQERKRGYCECCHVKYEDLDKHVKEEQHRQYVKTKTNYSQLDTLINSGPNTQHFLYEYLTKAAHIVNIKSGNSHNCFNENTSRRSPRKAVQDSTLKSLMKSPSKNAHQPTVQSPSKCQSPGKPSMRIPLQTVRVSPRKNLQKLSNDENLGPLVETPSLEALETKRSPGGRTRRNSEPKTAKASPDLHASARNTAMASGCRSPRLRGLKVLRKETDAQHKSSNEREKFGKVKDIVEEETKDAEIALSRNAASREKEESFGNTLRNVCVNKIMENSPKKKTSPRKQLVKSFAQENCEGSEVSQNINKENISPCKQNINIKETITEKSSHCKELKKTETDENQRWSEINTSHRKCAEKSRKKNAEDLVKNLNEGESNSCDKSLNKSIESSEIGASSHELDMSNYELTRVGFAEIVKYGKKRIEKEHSSDDFEVCFARSLEGETLPMWKKSSKEAVDKTFDEMVVHCENSGVMNNYNDSLTFDEKETEVDVNRKQKSPHKKHKNSEHKHLTEGKLMLQKAETDMSESGKKKHEKEKDVFDIDMESDIPSDFQCYNEQGKLVTFSKTLAERIKERSLGRRSSVESYNMNVLFQLPSRSRSNSFSSNHSDRTTKKVVTVKSKKVLNKIEKKKTGSSIASAKVVNKYRSKRLGQVQNENNVTGYQGDDENERTPEIRKREQSQVSQKKPRQKFWHYETVYESKEKVEHDKDLKGLPKELRELKGTSGWFSSDTSDVESRRSRKKLNDIENTELKKIEAFGTDKHNFEAVTEQRSTADEKNVTGYQGDDKNVRTPEIRKLEQSQVSQKKPRQKYWHYETVYESKEKVEHDKELKGLPKELRELKGTSGWISSDTSDVESRRSRKKLHKIENAELKRMESNENDLEKENQSEQNKQRESCKLGNLSTNFETEIEPGKSQRHCSNYSDPEHSSKMSPEINGKTEVVQQRRKNRKKSEGEGIGKNIADERQDQMRVKQTLNKTQSELDETSEKKYTASEKETKTVKHKTRKQFWDFVPVKDSPKKENVHKIPKKIRDSWNIGDSLTRCERRNSRKLPEYEETECCSTDEDHDENTIRKPLSRKEGEVHEKNDRNYRGSGKEMKKNNFKKRKQLGDFVPVEDNFERANSGKIPKELRDSWNTGDTLNRHDRRNSRKWPDYEETDSSSTDEDHDKNTVEKPLSRNQSELHENNDRKNRASEKEMRKNKFKKPKQFWDFVPVEDKVEREKTSKIPKELRDSWNMGDTLNKYDRRNSRKWRDNVETHRSSTDEDCNENEVGKALKGNKNKLNETDDLLGTSCKALKNSKPKSHKKYWDFLTIEDNINEERQDVDKLPKELRKLKFSKSYIFTSDSSDTDKRLRTRQRQLQKKDKVDIGGRHLRRKDTSVNYNESDCQDSDCQSDISGCCKGSGSEESSAAENKDSGAEKRTRLKSRKHYHETNEARDIVLNDAANSGQFKTGENNSDRDIGGVDNSDNDFSRPQSKRKVVPVEEMSVNVNKTLPKEVQMLQRTVDRRSRSCQSGHNVNDAEKSNSERSSRKFDKCLERHTHNCIVVVEERSVKDGERCKTKNNGKGAVLAEKYSQNTQKNSNLRDDCSQGLVSDDEERSVSPVFSNVHCQQNKVVRRKSPVFNRSPLLQLRTGCNKAQKKNSQNYVVKGKSIKSNTSSNARSKTNQKRITVDNSSGKHDKTQQSIKNSGDYCSDSEDELHADMNSKEISLNKVNNCIVDNVKTPEKSAPVKQPGSGYSNTPREKLRKQWKRKIVDSESAWPEEKKRKLEHTTDAVERSETVPTNLTIKTTPRRRLLESELKENQKIGEKNDDVLTGFREIKEKTQSVSHNDVDGQFSLTWKPVNADKVENKCEKVKLNRSWTMLSERSVSKLLSSEDDNENFDGFTDEDTLPSDMSYEEQSEVELPNDDQHEWVVEDKDEKSEIEENLIKYVPVFFPSPNKTSNSSWNDAIEGYIDNSVKHGPDSSFKGDNSSAYFSFNISPRKSHMKRNYASPQKVTGKINSAKIMCSPLRVNRQSTPKRKRNRHVQSPEVERVDAEIEFNFGSPRKNCSDFSPLKTVNGIVRNLSNTVNLTSTPVLKKSKKQKQKRTK